MRAILMYHSIDPSGSPISCHPDAFDRHIQWLSSGRVQVTSIEGLCALPESTDVVAITFDDGFVNFAEVAAPRLAAQGLASTLFVVSEAAGRTNAWDGRVPRGIPHLPLLDWRALAHLREQGVALGAHSRTHSDLTCLDADRLEDEVCGSAERIARETGVRPSVFAYPYGRVDARSAALVERTFVHGCTTEFRAVDTGALAARLPRLDAFYFQRPQAFELFGAPAFGRFLAYRHRLRQLRRAAETLAGPVLSLKTGR
jgi:peptidoglycan/xylan/chitin deacetylase (PgdA/CDA1 family)